MAATVMMTTREALPNPGPGQDRDDPALLPCKVAVDLTPMLPGGVNGGAKVFVLQLLRDLARLTPQWTFLLLTNESAYPELAQLEGKNIHLVVFTARPTANRFRRSLIGLARAVLPNLPASMRAIVGRAGYHLHVLLKRMGASRRLRTLGVNVLFCPFTAPAFAEAGIPTVSVIYDLQHRLYPDFFTDDDLANREWSFRGACRRADTLVTISEFTRDQVFETGIGIRGRIVTITLQAGQELFRSAESDMAWRSRILPDRNCQYLLYPANSWPHKNHELLLTAFAIACRDGLPTNLILVCTGDECGRHQHLSSAAQGLGIRDRVVFSGYLSSAELSALFRSARGLIFPSLCEGFGLPVIEAMSLGIPVACSATTALPEVTAGAALLFDPRKPLEVASAIRKLVNDTALIDRLTRAGFRRAQDFQNPEAMARAYRAELISARGQTRETHCGHLRRGTPVKKHHF